MTFDVRVEGRNTVLSFAYQACRHVDERYLRVNAGWAYYLTCLQRYLETGHGAVHADVDLARVVR